MSEAPPFTIASLSEVPAAQAGDVFDGHAADWERARYAALARPFDRRRYRHAHGALRLVLADTMRRPVDRLALHRSNTGKPLIVDGPWLSLSYEGADAWLAMAGDRPIGLDVVALSPGEALDRLMASDTDLAAVRNACPLLPRPDLVAWAAKEAAAKLTDRVERAPEAWQLRFERGMRVDSAGSRVATIEIRQLEALRVAAIARAFSVDNSRHGGKWGSLWT